MQKPYPLLSFLLVLALFWQLGLRDYGHRGVASRGATPLTSCIELLGELLETPLSKKFALIREFEASIAHLSSFKQNIIRRLWIPEIERGNFVIEKVPLLNTKSGFGHELSKHLGPSSIDFVKNHSYQYKLHHIPHLNLNELGSSVWIPYHWNVPKESARSLISLALSRGLSAGKDYLVIPLKFLVTNGVDSPIRTFVIVASLAGSGKLIATLGLVAEDPLLTETSPESLAEDEIIVIVNLFSAQKLSSQQFMMTDVHARKQIRELILRAPHKYVLIDLDNPMSLAPGARSTFHKMIGSRKVKKVVIAAHGQADKSGTISFPHLANLGMRLEDFGLYLSAFIPEESFSNSMEVHFDSCHIAVDDYGEEQIQKFAHQFFPSHIEGAVYANRYDIYILDDHTPTLRSNTDIEHPVDEVLNPIYYLADPAGAEFFRWIFKPIFARTDTRRSLPQFISVPWLKSARYIYTRPAEDSNDQ